MIIDIHAHLMSRDYPARGYWDGWVRLGEALSGIPAERIRRRLPEMWDSSGDMLVKEMDEANIDKSVIFPADFGLAIGEAAVSIEEQNRIHAQAVARHPDRLIAFVGVDPRRKEAVKLLEKGVKEWGMKGLKLLPCAGFYPNDKAFYPLYEKALKLKIPVLIHTGPEIPPFHSKYGRPVYVEDVALDFPDLTFIMAHAGGLAWWTEAVSIAANNTNIFFDLAAWQPGILNPLDFYSTLRKMVSTVRSRVLFGSDWPAVKLLVSQARWIKAFKEPPNVVAAAGIKFTPEEQEAILGGNAMTVLGLK